MAHQQLVHEATQCPVVHTLVVPAALDELWREILCGGSGERICGSGRWKPRNPANGAPPNGPARTTWCPADREALRAHFPVLHERDALSEAEIDDFAKACRINEQVLRLPDQVGWGTVGGRRGEGFRDGAV